MRPLLLLKGRRFCRPLLTAFIFFFSGYISNAQASGRGEESTVTFKGRDVPLSDLFKAIKKQTGYTVMYSLSVTQLDGKEKVTVNFNKAGIVEVMAYVLKGRNLVWTIVDESILIYKEEGVKKNIGPPVGVKEKSDTVINTVLPIVVGKVTDADDRPIPGATVIIKGTRDGAVTDNEGVFSLPNVNINTELVITSLGFKPRELVVKGKTIQVKMNMTISDLDETVILGYSTTTKRLATGNVATVTAKEIERQPVMNPLQALQGRVAGLQIQQINGYASSPFKVEIRGRNTINPRFTSDPLYIIDGVPLTILELGGNSGYSNGSTGFMQGFVGPDGGQNPFFSMNPNDIETVTVLKDADATAIFGSRAANGVIIITTKKGRPGKAKLEMNVYQGMSKVTRYYDLLNTQQYIQMRKEAFENDNINPTSGNAYDLLIWDTTRYIDWQKYLWGRVGKTTDAQFGFSGGDLRNAFRIAGGYHRQTDISTISGASQRGSLQFNLSHNSLNQRLSIGFTNMYSAAQTKMVRVQGSVTQPPNAPPAFDEKGNFNFRGWDPVANRFPFSNLLKPYSATTYFLNSNLQIKYEIIKGLSLSTNVGYSFATGIQRQIVPITSMDPLSNPKGSASFGYNNTRNWIVEPQMNYKRNIAKGILAILIGASLQDVSADGNVISGEGYANDNLLGSVSSAPVRNATDYFGRYKYTALFSQINYNWQNKYIVNLSARRDGSSRFGPGKQYGNFGAFGVAWIFTEENWFKNHVSFVSSGKIRTSYGTTGSDQISDYQYLTRWGSVAPYQGFQSYIPTQHANPDYHWSENRKLETALNLSFLKDKINFEIAWYRNRSDNQLISYPLPIQTGFSDVTANSTANVQNTGLEFLLDGKVINKNGITWSLHFNLGINRNKLLAYPNLLQSPYAYTYFVGKPLNINNLLHLTSVDPQDGRYTYEDTNKDGKIVSSQSADNDLFPYDLNPKFSGGLGSDFTYKGWSLNLFFRFQKQIDRNAYTAGGVPGGRFNKPIQVLDRWTKPGDHATFARFTTRPDLSDNNFQISDGVLSDASFIRLGNLSFSYSFPDRLTEKMRLKYFQIYFQGQNLFLISKYQGLDPEVPNFDTMPYSKVFTAGIKLSL